MHSFYWIGHTASILSRKFLFRMRIENKERVGLARGALLAANHQSNWDPPLIGSCFPWAIFYLGKVELFKSALMAYIMERVNVIPIHRGKVDRASLDKVKQVLGRGDSLLLFPEGSRKSTTVKAGVGMMAMQTGTAILPVYIEGSTEMWKGLFGIKKGRIVIGELIEPSYWQDWPMEKESYMKLSEYVLERVLKLRNAD